MFLERCKDQPSRTLDELYGRIAASTRMDRCGRAMLALIAGLRAVPDERRLWGLTSHERLCLLSENTSRSPWYVIFVALDTDNVSVEYLMPSEDAPWPDAYVRGHASSVDDAVRMILIGMDRSGGWPTSQ